MCRRISYCHWSYISFFPDQKQRILEPAVRSRTAMRPIKALPQFHELLRHADAASRAAYGAAPASILPGLLRVLQGRFTNPHPAPPPARKRRLHAFLAEPMSHLQQRDNARPMIENVPRPKFDLCTELAESTAYTSIAWEEVRGSYPICDTAGKTSAGKKRDTCL